MIVLVFYRMYSSVLIACVMISGVLCDEECAIAEITPHENLDIEKVRRVDM